MINYERGKRTEFLLAVISGSPRRHSNSSESFFKNRKKLKDNFMTILRLAESFKTKNRPGPTHATQPGPILTDPTIMFFEAYFSKSIKDGGLKCRQNFHSSLLLVLSKSGINIFDSLEIMRFSAT